MAWFTFLVVCYNWNVVAVRPDLKLDLALTDSQFSLIFTGPTLAAIFLSLVGGVLGDRYGIRLVVGLGAAVTTVGALLRLTATGFGPMFTYTILLG